MARAFVFTCKMNTFRIMIYKIVWNIFVSLSLIKSWTIIGDTKIIINLKYTFSTIFFTFSWNLFFGFLLDQPFTSITLHYNKLYHVKHNMFPSITSFMLKLDWQLINGFSSKFTSFVSKPLPYYIYLVFISFFFHQLKSSKVLWYHTYKIKQPGLFATLLKKECISIIILKYCNI